MTDPTLKGIEEKRIELEGPDPSEGLRLMRAFVAIPSRDDRLQVITLAEMLAAASPPNVSASD